MFGLTCSPFLLNATMRAYVEKHLVENIEKLLLQLPRNLYVDDTPTSFNDLTKATEFCHLTKSILASGRFNLQKWETNNLVTWVSASFDLIVIISCRTCCHMGPKLRLHG